MKLALTFLTSLSVLFINNCVVFAHTCVDVSEDLDYCSGAFNYLVSSDINATIADDNAFSFYIISKNLYLSNPEVLCIDQVPGETMCANCLAVQRTFACASFFPRCTPSNSEIGLCKSFCEDTNRRCSTNIDCGSLPSDECSSAPTLFASILPIILLVCLFVAS